MRTLRTRKSLVLLGLIVLVLAAFVPAGSAHVQDAVLAPLGLVVPTIVVTVIRRSAARSDEQPVALLSLVSLRAPPSVLALA